MRLSIALHALVLALVAVVYAPFTHAAAVNVAAVASGVSEQLLAVTLVGASVLLLAGGIAALRYVREVMGGGFASSTSPDLAPHVRGFVDQQSYLDSLASRLAAEDEFLGVDWRDESGKSNIDYMAEHGRAGEDLDRSQHSDAELAAYDKGLEQWSMARAQAEVFPDPEPTEFKAKDFAPPLSAAETAELDDFEAGYGAMWASQGQRVDAEASGSDMALYDRFISEDATHEEAMRWSNVEANQVIKLPKNY